MHSPDEILLLDLVYQLNYVSYRYGYQDFADRDFIQDLWDHTQQFHLPYSKRSHEE